MRTEELAEKARWVRQQILEMVVAASHGHIGGSLSCVEILVALYYGGVLKHDPRNPEWPERDRFILSKGQGCQGLYAVLADRGYFSLEELKTFGQEGSRLEGHPSIGLPGIEVSTGSLGNGLGIGAGMALAARMDGKDYRTVVLLGDGECYEGSLWEAAVFASEHGLGNLLAIVDDNGLMATTSTQGLNPLWEKWGAFGWNRRVVEGHCFPALLEALLAKSAWHRPMVVLARTVKGKGVTFMEGKVEWHHKVPKGGELEKARRELDGT